MLNVCAVCGKVFKSSRRDARTCSTSCRSKLSRHNRRFEVMTECEREGCHQQFKNHTRRQRFCSDACKQADYRARKARREARQSPKPDYLSAEMVLRLMDNE